MNIDHQAITATTVEPEQAWPMSKGAIIAICLICPIWGGVLLHLAWRNSSPAAAQYANRVTLRALGFVLAACLVLGMLAAIFARKGPRDRTRAPVPVSTTNGSEGQ